MSPTSDTTILLWGLDWWLPGRATPVPFPSLTAAAGALAGEWPPHSSRNVRLVFQPDSLQSVPVACPLGNRATLRDALGFEHPQIQDEANAWGFEPVLVDGETHASILHYEVTAVLFDLVSALRQRGFRVSSAWPLGSYLSALPEEWSEQGGFAVAALSATRSLCYRHPSNGRRTTQSWDGSDATGNVLRSLKAQQAAQPDDSILVVAAGEPPEAAPEGCEVVSIADVLAADVALPRSHPAQLLPPEAMLSAQRAVMAAGILLLLSGSWSGLHYAQAYRAATQRSHDEVIEKARLQSEIERFGANQSEIATLKAKLLRPTEAPMMEWLDQFCARLPRTVAIGRIVVARGQFSVEGHAAPGSETAFSDWQRSLAGPRWKIEPAALSPSGGFTLHGNFLP